MVLPPQPHQQQAPRLMDGQAGVYQEVFEPREGEYWSKWQRLEIRVHETLGAWEEWTDVSDWSATGLHKGVIPIGTSCTGQVKFQWRYWCQDGEYWKKLQQLYSCCTTELPRCWLEWRDVDGTSTSTGIACAPAGAGGTTP